MVLVTGMSGAGKSTALAELGRRGHRTVDTDYAGYAAETPDGQMWIESRISELLDDHREGALFLAGCVPNQGLFYPRFDAVALLTAPLELLLSRAAGRSSNPFGATSEDRHRIATDTAAVEPRLRATATAVIDTRLPPAEVADHLESLARKTATDQW
ncbi:AAA family ATPase [Actinoplanes sp. NPDC051633]|uniref:AAA family ATPase n=1 Tax=Actinoplanes sp. NPDC051633 TaxID=3155670 RepID=UPI00343D6E6C